MREPTPLFSLLGLSCYPYGAALALGLLLAALMALAGFRKAFGAAEDGLRLSLWALPLGFMGARLGYCAVKASFIAVDFGPSFLYRFGLGGYSMAGAFAGVLAAAALFGRLTRRGWLATLGAAMPALLLAAALGRFAECLTTEGIGEYVDNPFWQFFPFAVPDLYGDLRFPVFVWEGLTALVLCAVTWRCLRRPQDAALTGMLLFALTQVFWESLRRDGFLRFGFVRVNQLWCAVMLAAVTAVWLWRARPSRAARHGACWAWPRASGHWWRWNLPLTNPLSTTASSMPSWPPCWPPWARACWPCGGARWERRLRMRKALAAALCLAPACRDGGGAGRKDRHPHLCGRLHAGRRGLADQPRGFLPRLCQEKRLFLFL